MITTTLETDEGCDDVRTRDKMDVFYFLIEKYDGNEINTECLMHSPCIGCGQDPSQRQQCVG